ncbi:M17 family peptidase N-terminal domain-containing protein, partial [Sphingorhabdus sp.]|uniref:M17 family peptidase N-terminal domain-containing protein n=1 Tax=Sphingorhabdus sp. TaxID=1902408 RepID=UPI0037CC392D
MHRSFFALALASAAITPAFAQDDVIGSGIAPSAATHSQTRPINFAATAPTSGALVILMRNATLPANVVDAPTAQALNAAIASAKFEGKEGSSLSLRGIGSYSRIILSGVGEEGD